MTYVELRTLNFTHWNQGDAVLSATATSVTRGSLTWFNLALNEFIHLRPCRSVNSGCDRLLPFMTQLILNVWTTFCFETIWLMSLPAVDVGEPSLLSSWTKWRFERVCLFVWADAVDCEWIPSDDLAWRKCERSLNDVSLKENTHRVVKQWCDCTKFWEPWVASF